MNKLARIAVLVALLGCGSKGSTRSLLPVDVTAAADVGPIAQVVVFVYQDGGRGGGQPFAWDPPGTQMVKVGIYLPDYVMGSVKVEADALDVSGVVIGHAATTPGTVNPGKTSMVVSLNLVKVAGTPPDGGAPLEGGVPPGDTGVPPGDTGTPPDMAVPPDGGSGGAEAGVEGGPPDMATGLAWGAPENVEKDILNASYDSQTAIDGQGNVLVAWGESTAVRTRRYDAAAKKWGDVKTIVEGGGEVEGVVVGMGANGHATVSWHFRPDNTKPLEAGPRVSHSKDGGTSWSPPKLLHNGITYADGALAVSRDGHARLAWEEKTKDPVTTNDLNSLWSAYYNDTTGVWSDAALVKLGTDSYDRYAKIVMDASGGGLLTWLQPDMGQDSGFGTSFAANMPLRAVQLLDNLTSDDIYKPDVAVSSDGSRGVAMWVQRGTPYDLYFAEWTPAGFKAPERFLSVAPWANEPSVTMDQAGTITAVWAQPLASGKLNLVAARRPAGQAWGQPAALETSNLAGGFTDEDPVAVVAADSAGTVHVAWARKLNADRMDQAFSIVTRRFSGGMWLPEQTLAMKGALRASDPTLAVAADGRAVIGFWYYNRNGSSDPDAYNAMVVLFK